MHNKFNKEAEILIYNKANEDDFFNEKVVEEEKKKYISFYLNNECYAIDIQRVKENVKVPAITFLPGVSSHILGIINFHGNILSVIDLKKLFGISDSSISSLNRILVIEHGLVETGLLVDKIEGTIDIPISKIDPPMTTLEGLPAEFIEGESELGGKLYGILKVEKLVEKV